MKNVNNATGSWLPKLGVTHVTRPKEVEGGFVNPPDNCSFPLCLQRPDQGYFFLLPTVLTWVWSILLSLSFSGFMTQLFIQWKVMELPLAGYHSTMKTKMNKFSTGTHHRIKHGICMRKKHRSAEGKGRPSENDQGKLRRRWYLS